MSTAAKDIIYIDIDDEITGIIEKVQKAEHKIVALVLPKRAAVLQSIVNMKLLKRSADEAKKNLVLITSESSLLPLAGAVGLHVAKTLQTRPVIPTAPKIHDGNIDVDEPVEAAEDKPLDTSKPIGMLAGLRNRRDDEEETIEVDNTDKTPEELEEPVKKAPNKKLKVPNFNKFRTRLFLGGAALVILLILWYIAGFVMPRANIVIKTDTTSETANLGFTTNPEATEVNLAEGVLPSVTEQVKKTDTEKATATGQKDNGTKATGSITIRNCDYSDGFTISAGASFSGGGKNFVSTQSVTVPEFDGPASACTLSDPDEAGTATVPVQAAEAGDSYNVASRSYSVPGIPSSANVDAVGTAMSGGTTKIVKVLSQKDFDDARAKIEERAETEVQDELRSKLEERGYFVLEDSFIVAEPEVTSAPKVGEEANEATVTANYTYTMIGVKEDDLKALIRENMKDKVDDNNEMIQSTGLADATIRMTEKAADGKGAGTVQTIVVIGPKLNLENLKKEIAGKKKNQTKTLLEAHAGVKEVDVHYSPFWVFSTPGKLQKITITLERANTTND